MKKLSVIICYRDKEYERAQCCLESLNTQTFKDFDIIISDYGSTKVNIFPIINDFPNLDIKIIKTETTELWSRSISLNIGHKASKSKFTMSTDIDMLFDPKFLEVAINLMHQNENKLLMHRLVYDTKPTISLNEIREGIKIGNFWKDFYHYCSNSHRMSGGGACQIMLRENIYAIGGYDEKMRIWGAEESDFMERWKQNGWKVEDHGNTKFVHMYHTPSNKILRTAFENRVIKNNTLIYERTTKKLLPIIRNDGPWILHNQ